MTQHNKPARKRKPPEQDSEMMTIVRIVKRQRDFTQVQNTTIRDRRLSFRATGLLVYALSLPDGWRLNSTELATRKTEGRDAIRAAMDELAQFGYLSRDRVRTNGKWITTITVYEEPLPDAWKSVVGATSTYVDFPTPEKPASETQALEEDQGRRTKKDKKKPIRPDGRKGGQEMGWKPTEDEIWAEPKQVYASPPKNETVRLREVFKHQWASTRCKPGMENLLHPGSDAQVGAIMKKILAEVDFDRAVSMIEHFFAQVEASKVRTDKSAALVFAFMAQRSEAYKSSDRKPDSVERALAGVKDLMR